jgi:uncharacterized protein involved in exopolysaccharide biosynthesis
MAQGTQETTPAFASLWERRGAVAIILCVSLATGVAYTLFAPAVWEAKATVIFPVRQPSALGLASGDASALTSALGGPTPVRVYAGILESARTIDFVAKDAGLSRLDVRQMSKVLDQAMENTITVSASSRNPELAKKVVELHLQAMDRINEDLNLPQAQNDVEVINAQIAEERKAIAENEAALLKFQATAVTAPSVTPTGTGKDSTLVASPSQWVSAQRELELQYARVESEISQIQKWSTKVAEDGKTLPTPFTGAEKWRTALIDLEYQLRIAELSYAPTSPEVKKLREQISITRAQMEAELANQVKATQEGLVDQSSVSGQRLPGLIAERVALEAQIRAVERLADLAPAESVELSRLLRSIATHTTILNQLQAQLQLATIQKARDPNKWEVLDAPYVEDRPLNKSFVRNGALSLFLGSLAAMALCLRPSRTRAVRSHLQEYDEAA